MPIINGTLSSETLNGAGDAELINGSGGDDTINGGDGNDTLDGGNGNDRLAGGAGVDSYLFNYTLNDLLNVDTIANFEAGEKIILNGAFFTFFIGDRALNPGEFVANLSGQAETLNQFIVYETDTGALYYDVDGPGLLRVKFAQLGDSGPFPSLANTDFMLQQPSLSGTAGDDVSLVGSAGSDFISGLAGNDSLSGGDGHDSLDGGDGNDTLDGGVGDDTLSGGYGNDSFQGGAGNDFASFLGAVEGVTVDLSLAGSQDTGMGSDIFSGIENVIGGNSYDTLTGDSGDNALYGEAGDDLLTGGYGNDTIDGGAGNDTASYLNAGEGSGVTIDLSNDSAAQNTGVAGDDFLTGIENVIGSQYGDVLKGNEGANQLVGNDGNDSLSGHGGSDTISGGAGADTIDGGLGDDTLDGGADIDTVSYFLTSGVSVTLATPYSQNTGAGTDDLSGFENLEGSPFHDNLSGSEAANRIVGNGGGDHLQGFGGDDTLIAGAGVDTLEGGAGADSMEGGAGSDIYYVDNAGDVVYETEELNSVDVVYTSLPNYTLPDHVEHAYVDPAATGAVNITGNALGNKLQAGFGPNILDGGSGTDQVDYSVGASGPVKVNLSITVDQDTGGSGIDRLLNIEELQGSGSDDTLIGNADPNLLAGWHGNDTLDGGLGNDDLRGGSGTDKFTFSTLPNSATNFDTIQDFQYGEKIALDVSVFTVFTATGAIAANQLRLSTDPQSATAVLIYDRDAAGGGELFYDADANGAGAAIKFAKFNGAPELAAFNFEVVAAPQNFVGTPVADSFLGGLGDDSIFGAAGNDELRGNSGNDTIDGGEGDDSLYGGLGDDTLDGGPGTGDELRFDAVPASITVNLGLGDPQNTGDGTDRITNVEHLYGGKANDIFTGSSAANRLNGAEGNDRLDGKDGNDTLTGGTGSDKFTFTTTPNATSNVDTISDFGAGDSIELNNTAFTALTVAGTLSASMFRAGEGVTNAAAGETDDFIIYNDVTGDLYYNAAGNNSGTPILFATLTGAPALTAEVFTVAEAAGLAVNGTVGTDTLPGDAGPDTISGDWGNDLLQGGPGNDLLNGQGDDDSLEGGDGSDTLAGGDGNDTLVGGGGADAYLFDDEPHAAGNTDVIIGFVPGSDRIELRNNIFDVLNFSGPLPGEKFLSGNGVVAATTATQYFIYNSTTGELFYDADGNGSAHAPIRFASLSGGVALTAGDISLSAVPGSTITGNEGGEWLEGTDGNDVISGGAGDDVLDGDAGHDQLHGGPGNDTFYGGPGADTMHGDDGNDFYILDHVGDQIIEVNADLFPGGIDFVEVELSTYTLGANIEHAAISHSGTATLYGNALDNHLGAGGGTNTIDGGLGSDTVFFSGEGISGVTASLVTNLVTGGRGTHTLISIENITGTYQADMLTGNDDDNRLDGSDGNDTLIGHGGNDFFYEAAGDDSIDGGAGWDTLSYADATDALTVNLNLTGAQLVGANSGTDTIVGIEHLHGGDGNDKFTGTVGENHLYGNLGNDTLIGGGGHDILNGGMGADSMTGGDGNDSYYVDDAGDVVIETSSTSGGNDHVSVNRPGVTYVLGANIEAGTITASGAANLTGNALHNFLGAGIGDNILDGGDGFDTVSFFHGVTTSGVNAHLGTGSVTGGSGNDTLISIDHLYGTRFNDVLIGNAAANTLDANGGDDTVFGDAGSDMLMDSGGDDSLDGGADSDSVGYYNAGAGVTVNLTLTTPQNTGGAGVDTIVNIERLFGSAYDDNLTGDAQHNIIGGGAGNDLLSGNDGNDTLYGDGGNDTLRGGSGNDVFALLKLPNNGDLGVDVIEDFNGGDRLILDNNVFSAFVGVGQLSNTGSRLRAGPGLTTADDVDDFLIYDTNDGRLYYDADANGTASSPVHFMTIYGSVGGPPATLLASNIEITGIAGLTVGGSSDDDMLVGTSGNDTLNGQAGDDVLNGLDGADVLDGGTGADTMTGGNGPDTYYVDDIGDEVVESGVEPGGGMFNDRVYTSLPDYILGANVEDGFINTSGAANLTGNAQDNFLYAGAGPNVLSGGPGFDAVSYLNGATAGVTVSLAADGAQVTGGSDSDTLIDIESLFGSPHNDTLTGNAGNNALNGNGGNDALHGGDGNDVLSDPSGDDTLDGGAGEDALSYTGFTTAVTVNLALTGPQNTNLGSDTIVNIEHLYGGKGNDTFQGNAAANILFGNDGNDHLTGHAGSDTLDGGLGYDTLTGGANDDLFRFSTTLGGTNVDTITDFEAGVDEIALDSAIFTALATNFVGVDNLRVVTGAVAAQDANDFLIYHASTGTLYYDADGSGSASAPIHFATLANMPALSAGDFDVDGTYTEKAGAGTADVVNGTTGHDKIQGFGGNDSLFGDAGNDYLQGGSGNDTINGGSGSDTAVYESATGNVVVELGRGKAASDGEGGADVLIDLENIYGSAFNDILVGTSISNFVEGNDGDDVLFGADGNDTLLGGDDNDLLRGGVGNDYLDGEAGIDTADYSQATGGVNASLWTNSVSLDGNGGQDLLLHIENLSGGAYDDVLEGDAANNLLEGGKGGDWLLGLGGNDTLYGGAGDDELWGGDGNDVLFGGRGGDGFMFAHDPGTGNVDTIKDFAQADGDMIALDQSYMTSLPATLLAANLIAGPGATAADADDFLVYDTTTFTLYYDRDGAGTTYSPQAIVQVVGVAGLTVADISVFSTAQ